MKKLSVAFALLFSIILFSSSQTDDPDACGDGISRKSAGPPSCNAGEPPNFTTCGSSGCHDAFSINSGSAQLSLDLGGADSIYVPNQPYTITVSLSRTGLVRGGFQIIALQDNDISTTPGIITLTDNVRTLRIDAAHPHPGGCSTENKVWIEHTSDGIDNVVNNAIQWQFNWQAPASNVGTVTFYLASVDANADLDNTGDFVHTLTKTTSGGPVGIKTVVKPRINVFPNPANSFIQVETEKPLSISITNPVGETVRKQTIQSSAFIDIADLSSGIYFIRDEKNAVAAKFVKK